MTSGIAWVTVAGAASVSPLGQMTTDKVLLGSGTKARRGPQVEGGETRR